MKKKKRYLLGLVKHYNSTLEPYGTYVSLKDARHQLYVDTKLFGYRELVHIMKRALMLSRLNRMKYMGTWIPLEGTFPKE